LYLIKRLGFRPIGFAGLDEMAEWIQTAFAVKVD
jgi:hypothetical protein